MGLNQTAPFKMTNDLNDHLVDSAVESETYFTKHKLPQKEIVCESVNNMSESNCTDLTETIDNNLASLQQSVASCLVCFDAQPDSIFNPCAHGGNLSERLIDWWVYSRYVYCLGLCYECAIDLMKKTGECHLCRLVIFLDG